MSDILVTREGAGADASGRSPGSGRYVSVTDGHASEMTYLLADRGGDMVMRIDHTGVPKALAGRGVGLALVRRAVEDARTQGFRIEPRCSFVRVMIDRHKEWQDVLAS